MYSDDREWPEYKKGQQVQTRVGTGIVTSISRNGSIVSVTVDGRILQFAPDAILPVSSKRVRSEKLTQASK